MKVSNARSTKLKALPKAPTGITGLDDITGGGLPRGRPTLVCGGAGSGKTLVAVEFLVNGAKRYHESGVLMAFDETGAELAQNVASMGLDLKGLADAGKILVDTVLVDRAEITETGAYTLDGIFARLDSAIRATGARRVVLDSVETLFAGLSNTGILRAELARLFRWLKTRSVTAVVTAERGIGTLTRHGFEEYISDCVIVLDHRVENQYATRRMRVVKYRGSRHGTDEYPFLIDASGISVLPITALGLAHKVSSQRISSGVPRLDTMLGGRGYFRGSSVLISGTAGTGKTSLVAHMADAACRRGDRCLLFLFEESSSQLVRNMHSIGVDLEPWIRKGLLRIQASRPSLYGLESHLVALHRQTEEFRPAVVAVDPITNLTSIGAPGEVRSLMTRLIDYFKSSHITTMFTSLTQGQQAIESTDLGVSSLMDTWLMLRDMENNGERNRVLYVLKSRGMAHSNQVREFKLTDHRIELVDVYVGQGGVLTGTARQAQEVRERADRVLRQRDFQKQRIELERRQASLEAQLRVLQADLASTEADRSRLDVEESSLEAIHVEDQVAMSLARFADLASEREAS